MATTTTPLTADDASRTSAGALLVSLSSLPHEELDGMLLKLRAALPETELLVATPDAAPGTTEAGGNVRVLGYTPAAPPAGSFTLTAADFVNAQELQQANSATAVLLLGSEAQTLSTDALRTLAQAAMTQGHDLVVPCYDLPPRAGLVNSAILYPLTRALFAARPRFPLAPDLGLSARMLERLATAGQRFTSVNQPDGLVWPVAEASAAGYAIAEIDAGERTLPAPAASDLNMLLAQVTGSLFTDIDAKAAWWQRARPVQPARVSLPVVPGASGADDVQPMIEQFSRAYTNLREIWSLVLPPQTLLGLKRLASQPAEQFRMNDSLWARTVYDFLLAYRLRTINRGHLLGALTPLYLGWVASHILQTASGTDPERHVEAVAAAFEADKPYLVSRWRWPDRFNP